MVSFFGLKVGGKKKKSEKSPELDTQQWKKIDQNVMGEGQFFGKNMHGNGGSIREGMSRPGTSASAFPGAGAFKAPYSHDTHNFAASSMHDLSNLSHTQLPTLGGLKTSHSDANLGTHFGNTSSVSLAQPTLAKPTPGFSSRPATANGKVKPWVNPLDVHFMRAAPSGAPAPKSGLGAVDVPAPLTPKSPLGQFEIPPTPKSPEGDGHSLFGDKSTDNVVDDLFASYEQKEKDEREAKEREREEVRRREIERLEKERLERQKVATEMLSKPKAPTYPIPNGAPNPMFRGHAGGRSASPGPRPGHGQSQHPTFRGNMVPRSASPAGMRQGNAPLPQPGFKGHPGPRPASPAHRRAGPSPQPIFRGDIDQRPASAGGVPRNGPGPTFRGNFGDRPRSPAQHMPSPEVSLLRPHGPPQPAPPQRRGPSPIAVGPGPRPNAFAPNGPRSTGPVTGGPPSPGLSGLPPSPGMGGFPPSSPSRSKFPPPSGPPPAGALPASPGEIGLATPGAVPADAVPVSPTRSVSRDDYGPVPQPPPRSRARPTAEESKPVIQNVRAKRETLVVNDSKRLSLSMKIEELEKSLVEAQRSNISMRPEPLKLNRPRSGSTSSHYSDNEYDDDESISPIAISPIVAEAPAPLRTSPPLISAPAIASREQSPVRGGSRLGHNVHRPRPSEYGVKPARPQPAGGHEPRPRGGPGGSDPPRPAAGMDGTFGRGPRSRANTPQFRPPYRPEDNTPIHSPEPSAVPPSNPDASNLASAGFKFDFPTSSCPPTPDSLNNNSWPLNEPTSAPRAESSEIKDNGHGHHPGSRVASPSSPGSSQGSPRSIQRSHVPAPLNFDFSPSGYSRAPDRAYTPPIRGAPLMAPTTDIRPQTAGNASQSRGRISPQTDPFPGYEDESPVEPNSTGLGIGMARGPSMKTRQDRLQMPDRRPNHGLMSPTGIADQFGTKFV